MPPDSLPVPRHFTWSAPLDRLADDRWPDLRLVHLDAGCGRESELLRLLAADERARYERLRRPDDRRRYLIGRAALRTLLGMAVGRDPAALVFAYNPYGRPELAGETEDAPLSFNVSHAGDFVALAISRASPVGIDLEQVRTDFDWRAVAARHLDPREIASWGDLAAPDAARAFYRAWTRYEAVRKAVGTGIAGAPAVSTGDEPLVTDLALPAGYVGAVAVARVTTAATGRGPKPARFVRTYPAVSGVSAAGATFCNRSIIDCFDAVVGRYADRLAVDDGRRALTYRELHALANAGANTLRRLVPEGLHRVVLLADPGAGAVIATLAVLKAGAAYVPLDPALSADVLQRMVAQAEPALVLYASPYRALAEVLALQTGLGVCLDDLERGADRSDPGVAIEPDALACIHYTSGSTGPPKGVCDSHRNVLHNIWRYTTCLRLEAGDRMTLLQAPHFSGAVSSLFGALLNGATCLPYDVRAGGLAPLGAWMRAKEVTVFHAVPALFREAIAGGGFPRLRCVRLEGDQAARRDLDLFRRHCEPGTLLANGLGATECGLVRQWRITPATPLPDGPVPIGTPVPDMEVVLLDDAGAEVAAGEIGQIAVRSRYLALGYWRQPELTAARFIADPADPARRTYLTGDLGRMLPGELLVYLGRKDLQARLNGRWVDAEAIERALASLPGVREAAVAVHRPADADPQLVAYVVPAGAEAPGIAGLRSGLAAAVPGQPMPTRWRFLERLPLNANLKVDRRNLPPPDAADAEAGSTGFDPRDATGRALAELWAEVLGVRPAGSADNFFDRGGDSLKAMRLVARFRAVLGCELPFSSVFQHPTFSDLAQQVAAAGAAPARSAAAGSGAADTAGRLSFAQERLWFLDRFEGGSAAYHVADAVRIRGPLDEAALAGALQAVAGRHETLRTRIADTPEGPRALVSGGPAVSLRAEDLASGPGGPAAGAVTAALGAERDRPFELADGPLFRAVLFRLGPDDHVFLRTWHHLVADGLSLPNFNRELAALYRAAVTAAIPSLPELPVRYYDYAREQQARLREGAWSDQVGYWRRQLEGVAELALPTDHPRPARRTMSGAQVDFVVDGARTERLRAFNRRERVTPFMSLLAVFQVLLARLTDQDDVVIGMPVSHRPAVELEPLIGLFVNPLAVRTNLGGEPDFRAVVQRVRTGVLEAVAHQDVPFEKIVEILNPLRDPGRTPLFQVVFAMQDETEDSALQLEGVAVEPWRLPAGSTRFDLELHVTPGRDGWSASFIYATELFDPGTVERLARRYLVLLDALLEDGETSIWRSRWLEPDEERMILRTWNDTTIAVPSGLRVHELVRRQAHRTPEAIAVECEGQTLRYRELEEAAARVATQLRRLGVGRGVRVGLCLGRSVGMVTGLLGILEAGGAYVPLDPRFPASRLNLLLAESAAPVLVTLRPLVARFSGYRGAVLCLEEIPPGMGESVPPEPAAPDDPAYILFTSGTTGVPKGVVVEHRSVVNLLWNHVRDSGLSASDVVLGLATLTFDFSVLEIFPPLMVGARLVIASDEARVDGRALAGLIRRHGVTVMNGTPTTWRLLLAAGWEGASRLRAISGGEVLSPALARELVARTAELWNIYGPTETTVYSLFERVTQPERVSLGRPIGNTRVYVVDRHRQLLPAGVPGELLIAGDGVARGYWGRPEATAERFGPDPFAEATGARAYRTGDRGRWRADGTIEFLGRTDDQVKVRGVRIELGEVEAALRRHADVRAAVVVLRAEAGTEPRLAGFVVPADPADPTSMLARLRGHLRETLPAALVPAELRVVDRLPLTPAGKVDRSALARSTPPPVDAATAPAAGLTPLERELIVIWQELLPGARVGRTDNFFDLGGHSLLAARLVGEIERRLAHRLTVASVFLAPTVADLAGILERSDDSAAPGVLLPLQAGGGERPLFCVHGWGGGVQGFVALAREFAPDRPVLGLQGPGRVEGGSPVRSVEAMAAGLAAEIRSRQPDGPYHLLGHSAGGWIALAVAQELTRGGARVATLALLDPDPLFRLSWAMHARVQIPFLWQRVGTHGREWWRLPWAERWRYLSRRMAALRRHVPPRPGIPIDHEDAIVAAVARYRPEPYPGEVVLVVAEDSRPALIPVWRRLARGELTLRRVAGSHHTLLEPPHVQALAAVLKDVIRERDRMASGGRRAS